LKVKHEAESLLLQEPMKMSNRTRDSVRSDRRLTVRMGEELNLSHTTIHQILTNELWMRKICAKIDVTQQFQ